MPSRRRLTGTSANHLDVGIQFSIKNAQGLVLGVFFFRDARALQFTAMRGNLPIDMQIAVEVNFHPNYAKTGRRTYGVSGNVYSKS
jgi:hypothetical protein